MDDDVFLERAWDVGRGEWVDVTWHGGRYRVPVPAGLRPPAFLVLEGLTEPPPGDAVLVIPRRATVFNFWTRPSVTQAVVSVEPRFSGPGAAG